MTRRGRCVLIALLLTAALGLCVVGEATHEDRWPYPTSDAVVSDYDGTVGERALLFGSVQAVSGSEATILVREGTEEVTLTVRAFEAAVEPGGVVQVLGVLEPDRQLRAERVVVVNRSAGAQLTKYAFSLVGLLVFLALFARHWQLNMATVSLEARDDG